MTASHDDALIKLRKAAALDDVHEIDAALAEILREKNPDCIPELLKSLNDSSEYDEGMFSLIHAAESFDDPFYIRAVLDSLPSIVRTAPRWASIVLMRILNHPPSVSLLVQELSTSSEDQRNAVKGLCLKINDVDPSFSTKTDAVVVAAS